MLKLKTVICTLFSLIIIACTPSKTLEKTKKDAVNSSVEQISFPEDWMGYWKGDLEIYKKNKLIRTLPMALDHAFTDTTGYYKWAIIYGADTIAGRRDYYLKTVDADVGHYQTDERNSIFLDSYLFDNQLIAYYDVESIIIQSTYTLTSEEMHFEILAIDPEPIAKTGNQIIEGDTIPEVKSYAVTTKQKAVLRKVR